MSAAADCPPALSNRPSESLVVRTLLAIASQRSNLDETGCKLVLEWLQTAAALRAVMRRSLASYGLTELKFSILVTLFTLDPNPAMEADLANHARVARPSVTKALHGLEEERWVARVRSTIDHRITNVTLTKKGHTAIDTAIQHYLETAGHLAHLVEKEGRAAASVNCARLGSAASSNG